MVSEHTLTYVQAHTLTCVYTYSHTYTNMITDINSQTCGI